ncbi:MAG: hypothetical protein QOD39_3453 [Mycobacterium sp.]|nr:hypothetical protein [Mycobacterium sp.]
MFVGVPERTHPGDLVIADVAASGSTTFADPVGWHVLSRTDYGTATVELTMWRLWESADGSRYDIVRHGADVSVGLAAYSGIDGGQPVGEHSTGYTHQSTAHRAPSVTARDPDSLVAAHYAVFAVDGTRVPAGFVERWREYGQLLPDGLMVDGSDHDQSAAGASGDKYLGTSYPHDSVGHLTVIKPAPAVPQSMPASSLSATNANGSSPSSTSAATPPARSGYWELGATGHVYAFGDAPPLGEANDYLPVGATAVHIEASPSGQGYWIVDDRGDVFGFGDASYLGGSPALAKGETISSLSATPDGGGYWLFSSRGRAVPYGNAEWLGDMAVVPLNGPVLGSVATPSGRGYYMVAADGGTFAFGDAAFHGSMGARRLNSPLVGLVPDRHGAGYWLVAGDGGVFAFDAMFVGSMGGQPLNKPVIGMVSYGNGYLMVASDGGIFDFSDKAFGGSLGGEPPTDPIVGVTATPV